MTLSVFVEPTGKGYRASTGSPLDLTAEAATVDEVMADIRSQFALRLKAGCQVRTLTMLDVEGIAAAAAKLSKNPMLPEMQ